MWSFGPNVLRAFLIEQSASEPPIPKPIASMSLSVGHVKANAAGSAVGMTSDEPGAGSISSIDDQPAWVGTLFGSTVQVDETVIGADPLKDTTFTAETSPSLLRQRYERSPLPIAEIVAENVISSGQAPT